MRALHVCGLLFLLGTGEVRAQVSGPVVQPVPSPPHHGRIDPATGRITRDSDDKTVSLLITWANTDFAGYYVGTAWAPAEFLDWGVLSTSSGSDIVGEFQFAYATTVLDTSAGGPGVSTCVNFYDDATGWCNEWGQGIVPDASYCFSGLGGSPDGVTPTAWVYNVNLAGGAEFEQDLGPFGYSLVLLDTGTGPLCCWAGTINGGPDADGQEDYFDVYVPDVKTGTCGTYGPGPPGLNFRAWWLALAQADGNGGTQASSAFRCGSGVNANTFTITSDPVLGGTFAGSVAATGANVGAFLAAFSTPLTLTTSWGEILVNLADPGGELLGLPFDLGDPAEIALPIPIDLTLCGALLSVQAVGFGGGITLTCAYDCAVGF
ncbi:MAG: hypothetical protein AB1793_09605 [Candidatus Thermoplasmatota archaeon]